MEVAVFTDEKQKREENIRVITEKLEEAFAENEEWLTEKVHQYGALKKPFELLQEGTGEGLNASYLANHLKEKYTKLYNL